ncbi:MAG: hypothetical protein ABR578_03715 [Chromatocurvus sp.]
MMLAWYARLKELDQLEILQKIIMPSIFVPFAIFYMKTPLKLD